MGIEFRKGNYVRRVRFGKRTIKEGEACVIWNRSGRMREVHGGKLVHLWFSTIRFLDSYSARENQYLRVVERKGEVKHIRGPILFYRNPVHHEKVTVHEIIRLESAAQRLVLYSTKRPDISAASATTSDKTSKAPESVEMSDVSKSATAAHKQSTCGDNVEIRTISGPKVLIPAVGEWVHEFQWTNWNQLCNDENAQDQYESIKIINTSEQEKILKMKVRSADGGVFYLTMGLKFQIADLDTLLKNSVDLPVEMYNAIKADLAILGPSIHSQEFLADNRNKEDGKASNSQTVLSLLSNRLSDISATFSKLKECCESKGVHLNSVGMVSFDASAELNTQYQQFAHQAAKIQQTIQAAEQRHQMQDRELALAAQRHQVEMEALERNAALEKRKAHLASEQRDNENKQVLDFLKELKKEGVDLTEALKALSGLSFYGAEPKGAFKAMARAPALGLA